MKTLLLIPIALMVVSCASTKSSNKRTSSKYEIISVSCTSFEHPDKDITTGDYQACKHNTAGDFSVVTECMEDHGWTLVSKEGKKACARVRLSYSKKAIKSCLSQAMKDNKASHELMNECLSTKQRTKEGYSESVTTTVTDL